MSDEYPKWVKVHDSHIHRKQDGNAPVHISTPAFPEFHVDRDGNVTVLVKDKDEEEKAVSDVKPAEPEHFPKLEDEHKGALEDAHKDAE